MNLIIPIERSVVSAKLQSATKLKKAKEHLGKVRKTKAKNTVGPRAPADGSNPAGTQRQGSSKPESSKQVGGGADMSKRGGNKPPYDKYKTGVSGETSSAVDNYLKLQNVKTGKTKTLKLGSAHKARFDHSGNCIRITFDGKRYPVQNHLVHLPKGVYRYSGMVSAAAKVMTGV